MSAKTKSASTKSKRVRRSPEAARQLILSTAADRLANMGLTGLNISGVAEAAGMSHATVIHHFGSTTAMRQALLSYMTTALLTDVREALARQDSPDQVLAGLFEKLSTNNPITPTFGQRGAIFSFKPATTRKPSLNTEKRQD